MTSSEKTVNSNQMSQLPGLVKRLESRGSKLGLVEQHKLQPQIAKFPGWILQRSEFLEQLQRRYVTQSNSAEATDLILAVPGQPVPNQQTSRTSNSKPTSNISANILPVQKGVLSASKDAPVVRTSTQHDTEASNSLRISNRIDTNKQENMQTKQNKIDIDQNLLNSPTHNPISTSSEVQIGSVDSNQTAKFRVSRKPISFPTGESHRLSPNNPATTNPETILPFNQPTTQIYRTEETTPTNRLEESEETLILPKKIINETLQPENVSTSVSMVNSPQSDTKSSTDPHQQKRAITSTYTDINPISTEKIVIPEKKLFNQTGNQLTHVVTHENLQANAFSENSPKNYASILNNQNQDLSSISKITSSNINKFEESSWKRKLPSPLLGQLQPKKQSYFDNISYPNTSKILLSKDAQIANSISRKSILSSQRPVVAEIFNNTEQSTNSLGLALPKTINKELNQTNTINRSNFNFIQLSPKSQPKSTNITSHENINLLNQSARDVHKIIIPSTPESSRQIMPSLILPKRTTSQSLPKPVDGDFKATNILLTDTDIKTSSLKKTPKAISILSNIRDTNLLDSGKTPVNRDRNQITVGGIGSDSKLNLSKYSSQTLILPKHVIEKRLQEKNKAQAKVSTRALPISLQKKVISSKIKNDVRANMTSRLLLPPFLQRKEAGSENQLLMLTSRGDENRKLAVTEEITPKFYQSENQNPSLNFPKLIGKEIVESTLDKQVNSSVSGNLLAAKEQELNVSPPPATVTQIDSPSSPTMVNLSLVMRSPTNKLDEQSTQKENPNNPYTTAQEISINNSSTVERQNLVLRKNVDTTLVEADVSNGFHPNHQTSLPISSTQTNIQRNIAHQNFTSSPPANFREEKENTTSATTDKTLHREVSVAQIAEQVSRILSRQLTIERERRGMNLWY